MLKLIFFTIVGGILASVGIFFSQHPGAVNISYLGYEIATTVPFLLFGILVLVLSLRILLLPFRFLNSRRKSKALDYKNTILYAKTLAAFLTDDTDSYVKPLKKLWYSLGADAKISAMVLDVLIAKKFNRENDLLKAVESLQQDERFALFAYKELISFYRQRNNYLQALSYVKDAMSAGYKADWLSKELVELEIKTGNLEKALPLLEEAYKAKAIDKDSYKKMKSVLLLMLSDLPYKAAEGEDLLVEANRLDSSHTMVALKLSSRYRQEGKSKKALEVLSTSFRQYPALPLYREYVAALTGQSDIEKLKAVEKLVSGIDEDMKTFIMADLYIRISLWGQAWNELKKYLEKHELTPALCKMTAKIERFSGIQYHITECTIPNSEEKLFDTWQCDKCSYVSPGGYKAQCDNCGTIGSIVWKQA